VTAQWSSPITTTRPPSATTIANQCRLQRLLQRTICNTIIVPSVPLVISTARVEYIYWVPICYFIMFSKIMLMCFLLPSMIENCMLGVLIMINLVRNLIMRLSNFPTIKKPYNRQFVDFGTTGFIDSMRLEKFNGKNFKR
jgi:hypothetical protein